MIKLLAYLNGFGLGGSLIIAIGAQNAYLIRRSLAREFPYRIATIFILCDILLIVAGVAGAGYLLESHQQLMTWFCFAGSAWLYVYAYKHVCAAIRGGNQMGVAEEKSDPVFWIVILEALALTFLNPHAYLDSMVLIGSISTQYLDELKVWFTIGVVTASFVWFLGVAKIASQISHWFASPKAWRILDSIIAVVLFGIASSLLHYGLTH